MRAGWRRGLRVTLLVLATIVIAASATWAAFALGFEAPGGATGRRIAIAAWALFALGIVVVLWRHDVRIAIALYIAAFAGLLFWWATLEPSNTRIWADDVAHTVTGHVDGERVVLEHVRNFDWRSRTDYTPAWETRRYDLDRLESVDMILSYWTGPRIAHTLVSFGFADGRHVVFSVEIRREKHELFSEIGGFFKQFELSVIAADERDIVRLRTNIRGEDVYLYRLQLPAATRRALFVAYLDEANRLASTPRFYHTLTTNCTTLVWTMMRGIVGRLPLDYRLLLSGYLPEYAYEAGGLDRSVPLETLRALGRITDRARAADRSPTFSRDIRVGVPGHARAD